MAAKLRVAKTSHLKHLDKTIDTLKAALDEEEPNVKQVRTYMKMLEEKYNKVIADSVKIQEVLTDDAELTKEIEDMDTLEDTIIDLRLSAEALRQESDSGSKVKTEVDELNSTLIGSLLEQFKDQEENATLPAILELIQKLKHDSFPKHRTSLLPTMTLPRFNGNIEHYSEFIDSFEAAIRNHPEVEDVEKFILLKTHLDPPASQLLEGFSTNNDDYAEALQLVKDTYGNKSLLRQLRISKLLTIERHDGQGSIRSIYNQVRTHIRSLESLDVITEQYSLFLVPIVLSKFSKELNKRWYKPSKENKESITYLLNWLKEEVESTESAIYLEEAFRKPH